MSHRNKNTHGTAKSYLIGFILSLVLTLVPYYLVVNQIITGTALLFAIMFFALAQLIVQITYFLHLGRGPKPDWNLYFFISTVGIILVVVGGSIFIINNLIYNMLPSDQSKQLINREGIYQVEGTETGACYGQHVTHKVTIKDRKVSPQYTFANYCDTLLFINEDEDALEITFGEHDSHEVYAGIEKLVVRKGRSQALKLSEIGQYEFHDHLDSSVIGHFIVTSEEN